MSRAHSSRSALRLGLRTYPARALVLLTALALTSCGILGPGIPERRFAEQFPYEDLNRTLVLRPIEGVTETNLSQAVTLQLENHGDQMVAFSPEGNIEGLVYDRQSDIWVEVENAVSYPDIGWMLGPQGGEIPSSTAIYFEPATTGSVHSMDIRVLVVGHIWGDVNGPGEAVAAYLDLALEGDG